MFWLNLILILRNLKRNKLFTFINIIGIVIGFTVSTLLLLYVKSHIETDKFFPNAERIYRIENKGSRNFSRKKVDVIRYHVPQIEHITKYHDSWSQQDIIRYNNRDFEIKNGFYADSVFFSVFQFEALYGNIIKALDEPYSMVLTKSQSEKIFGDRNPVGESVVLKTSGYGINDYTVKAVIKDIPNNCSFGFDAAFSLSSLNAVTGYNDDANNWGSNFYSAFVLLKKNVNPDALCNNINEAFKKNSPEWISNNMSANLNPLSGLHFSAKYGDGVFYVVKKPIVSILGVLGMLILFMACFNYFNLTQAQIDEGIKGIVIRKTVGARKKNLSQQSIMETSVLFVVALILTIFALAYVLPFFNNLTYSSFALKDLLSSTNLVFIILFFLISLLLFAIFPAMIIGRQKVVDVLNSGSDNNKSNSWLKSALVGMQFLIAIILIISTIMLNKQYRYMLKSDYGFEKENIVYIPLSPESLEKMDYLEQEFERNSITDEVVFGSNVFGQVANTWGRDLTYKGERIDVWFDVMFVCHDFLNLFDIEMDKGRKFNQLSSKNQDMIFNQAFVEKYNLSDPLEGKINQGSDRGKIIGVVKDFNYNPMRDEIRPMAFLCSKDWCDLMFVKFNSNYIPDIKHALAEFEKEWNEVSPNYPFRYQFLDNHFEEVYDSEMHMMKILTTVSVLIIIIGAMGLFGISYYATNKRIKEIGIRKVNGARIIEIMGLLNKSYILKILLAFVFACPLVYLIIEKWLQMYAYRTEISWWIFFTGGAFVVIMALLTISLQSYKVASKNPVEALRYE